MSQNTDNNNFSRSWNSKSFLHNLLPHKAMLLLYVWTTSWRSRECIGIKLHVLDIRGQLPPPIPTNKYVLGDPMNTQQYNSLSKCNSK